uniref:T-box domain-containing protein n=1 Tax=Parascaris equorum TaxID=6256 RepID=A0A914RDD9_PAREQ
MEFVAVTQYQNIHIVELKNQFNPYAKGQRFRRCDKTFQSRKRSSDRSSTYMDHISLRFVSKSYSWRSGLGNTCLKKNIVQEALKFLVAACLCKEISLKEAHSYFIR